MSAIAGILKAPLDILADKLRGYIGMLEDLRSQPDKVLAACEALAPHLLHVALTTSDPDKNVPVTIWMHRGCVPFVSHDHFNKIYWPTLKPIIEELWADDIQTLFYAEGDWDHHLQSFAELPDQSIVYHVDQADIFEAHRVLGDKFCLSGGIPNVLLAYGTPDDVRKRCKEVIDGVARDGGYILDASAIMQNDTRVENMQAMTDFVRDYGVYSGSSTRAEIPSGVRTTPHEGPPAGSYLSTADSLATPVGDVRAVGEETGRNPGNHGRGGYCSRTSGKSTDALANMYIWQILLSF